MIPAEGWFCPPTIVTDLPAGSQVSEEEIFGPVLTLERVRSVDAALDVVDAFRYALTGGIFSRNPRVIDAVVSRSPVGNLYINRGITGAIVARQPFGGNRCSGIGAKVGGLEPRPAVRGAPGGERDTMRHGLVVE